MRASRRRRPGASPRGSTQEAPLRRTGRPRPHGSHGCGHAADRFPAHGRPAADGPSACVARSGTQVSAGRPRPASGVRGRQPEGSTARWRAGSPPRSGLRPRGSPGLPTRIDLGRRRPRWRGRARLSRCRAGTTRTTRSGSRQRAARGPLQQHTWHARAVRPTARADCAPRGTARRTAAGTVDSRGAHRAPAPAPASNPVPARSLPCRLGSRPGRRGLRHRSRLSRRLLRQRLELDHSSLGSDVAHVRLPSTDAPAAPRRGLPRANPAYPIHARHVSRPCREPCRACPS